METDAKSQTTEVKITKNKTKNATNSASKGDRDQNATIKTINDLRKWNGSLNILNMGCLIFYTTNFLSLGFKGP